MTRIFAVTTLLGVAASVWLFLDNRSLRARLDEPGVPPPAQVAATAPDAAKAPDPWLSPKARSTDVRSRTTTPQPALPADPGESKMDRRARRTAEFGAMFGRHDGETEQEYRDRIGPLVSAGLLVPRTKVAEYRRAAEQKANVTPAQSAKLDQAFDKVYADVLDYTNKAVADGQLSPYERNVAGWLDYAGGLGGILDDAQGQVGKILSPDQMKTMYDSGFEWGEYLGVSAPWEKLNPPPPAPR